jgi:hypothetical protein
MKKQIAKYLKIAKLLWWLRVQGQCSATLVMNDDEYRIVCKTKSKDAMPDDIWEKMAEHCRVSFEQDLLEIYSYTDQLHFAIYIKR